MTIILTHNNADFDALAAQVAATKLYPGSYALAPEQMQLDVALFMENYEDQLPVKTAAGMEGYPGADVIVVVDCRKRSSLGIFCLSWIRRERCIFTITTSRIPMTLKGARSGWSRSAR